MNHSLFEMAKAFLKAQHKKKIWYRVLYSMAVLVIFVTTYMLILPAITMERPAVCGMEEHVHTEECYAQAGSEPVRTLNCGVISENPVIHTHDANCYDENGNLICQLSEVRDHIHTDACHTSGLLLTCGLDEEGTEGFGDGSADLFSDGADIFSDGEAHIHTEECYQEEAVLNCDEQEVIPHTHGTDCYDEAGKLICTLPEIIEHQHTEECFTETEISAEPALTCGKEEHVHTEACYPVEESTPTPEPTIVPDEEITETPTPIPEPTELPEVGEEPEEEGNIDETVLVPEVSEVPEEEGNIDETVPVPEVSEVPEEEGNIDETVPVPEVSEEPEEDENIDEVIPTPVVSEEPEKSGNIDEAVPIPEVSEEPEESGDIDEAVPTPEVSEEPEEEESIGEVTPTPEAGEVPAEDNEAALPPEESETSEETEEETSTTETAEIPLGEFSYICGETEHIHNVECYDDNGVLTCELEEHVHTEECMKSSDMVEENTDCESLIDENATSWCVVYKEVMETSENEESDIVSPKRMMSRAADGAVDFGNFITSALMYKQNADGSWSQSTSFTDGDVVKVEISYYIPSGQVTSNRHVIFYQLPNGVRPLKEETGTVYNGGLAVGTYVIGTDGEIVIDFEDDFATDGSGFPGTVQFQGTVSKEEAGDDGKISFGGSGTTITIEEQKLPTDIKAEKTATLSEDKKTVNYEVTVSSQKGTEGEVTITDKFREGGNATGTYQEDSFAIYKVDTSGNQTQITDKTPVFDVESDRKTFTISPLPKLEAGEKYVVTYSADVSITNSTNGAGSLTNSAGGISGKNNYWSWNTVEISKARIEKGGVYDKNTGLITWRITVNSDKNDLGGYKLSDTLPDGLSFNGDVEITDSDGNIYAIISQPEGNTFTYIFESGASDTYTVTYQTTAPQTDGDVTNNAELEKDGEGYSSSETVTVEHRTLGVKKNFLSEEYNTSSGITKYKWQTEIVLPEKPFTEFEFVDTIEDAVDSAGIPQGPDTHYAHANELQAEIEANLQLFPQGIAYESGSYLKYADNDKVQYEITYYDKDGKEVPAGDATTPVKSFKIKVVPKTKDLVAKKLLLSYSTIVGYRMMEEGETWNFKNKGAVGDKTSEPSHYYTKPFPLTKQVSLENGALNDNLVCKKFSSGNATLDYDDTKGILHYRLILRTSPDENGAITLTDILPEGAVLVAGSVQGWFYGDDQTSVWRLENDHMSGADYDFAGAQKPTYVAEPQIDGTTLLTIKIQGGYNKNNIGRNAGQKIAILYDVSIQEDSYWNSLTNESKLYVNKATWEDNEAEQKTEIVREVKKVQKYGTQLTETMSDGKLSPTNDVEYTVIINPAGEDLNPNADTLTLTDTMTGTNMDGAYLQLDQLKIYRYNETAENHRGEELGTNYYKVQYDESVHKITITLPDEYGCVLVYRYTIDPAAGNTPTLSNSVNLTGEYGSTTETVMKDTSSSATATKGKVTVYKVDGDDYSKLLTGARFTLKEYNNGSWSGGTEYQTVEGELEFTTNAQSTETNTIKLDTLYCIEETKAPDGYQIDPTIRYFVLLENGKTLDSLNIPSDVDKNKIQCFGAQGGTLYVPNEYTSIGVKKIWADSDGKLLDSYPENVEVELLQHSKIPEGCKVTLFHETFDRSGNSTSKKEQSVFTIEPGTSVTVETGYSLWDSKEKGSYTIQVENGPVGITEIDATDSNHLKFITGPITESCTIIIKTPEYFTKDYIKNVLYTETKNYQTETTSMGKVTLSETNHWSYNWPNLSKYDDKGNEYYYTIKEISVSGYHPQYMNNDGIQKGEITITNIKEESNGYELPETGGPGTKLYTLGGLLLSVLAALLMYKQQKQRREVN